MINATFPMLEARQAPSQGRQDDLVEIGEESRNFGGGSSLQSAM
jgi:hypothetical protein